MIFLPGPKSIEMMKVPKQHLYYLSMLLHEALLKEDYIQAGYLMLAILRSPQHVPEQIWKVGNARFSLSSTEFQDWKEWNYIWTY